jgi:hypothetical protein
LPVPTQTQAAISGSLLSGKPTMREGYISADRVPAGDGVEIEPNAHLLAIDTKTALTLASLLLGIGQGHGHGWRRR